MKALHAVVHGRVQGVGFRYATVRQAQRLGLAGWVANRPDGAVEVYAQGDPGGLSALATWLQDGPGTARVDRVELEEREPDLALTSFVIR